MENVNPPPGFHRVDVGPGYGAAFGPVFGREIDDRRLLGFRVAPHHVNLQDVCHGGALATFADMQLIAIRQGEANSLNHTPTINLVIDYLGPAVLGAWVEGDVLLVKKTRRLIFAQVIMRTGGEVVARSSAIYRANSEGSSSATP